MVGPTLKIKMTSRDWTRNLRTRLSAAKRLTFSEFRDEALSILKETALEKIQHRYIGNTVGGYYEGLDFVIRPNGFDLVDKAPYASFVESGRGPVSAGRHPMVFRGSYPANFTEKTLSTMGEAEPKKKKAKKNALGFVPTVDWQFERQQKKAEAARARRRMFEKARHREETDAKNYSVLRKQVTMADRRFQEEIGSRSVVGAHGLAQEVEGSRFSRSRFLRTPEANYAVARSLMKKSLGGQAKYKYGIYTVFAENVKGFKGREVLKTAGKRIAAKAREYLKKKATVTLAKRRGGYTIGLGG